MGLPGAEPGTAVQAETGVPCCDCCALILRMEVRQNESGPWQSGDFPR